MHLKKSRPWPGLKWALAVPCGTRDDFNHLCRYPSCSRTSCDRGRNSLRSTTKRPCRGCTCRHSSAPHLCRLSCRTWRPCDCSMMRSSPRSMRPFPCFRRPSCQNARNTNVHPSHRISLPGLLPSSRSMRISCLVHFGERWVRSGLRFEPSTSRSGPVR